MDQLAGLLINKGVITEAEWDEVLMAWADAKSAKPEAETTGRLNPEDVDALDAFFGD